MRSILPFSLAVCAPLAQLPLVGCSSAPPPADEVTGLSDGTQDPTENSEDTPRPARQPPGSVWGDGTTATVPSTSASSSERGMQTTSRDSDPTPPLDAPADEEPLPTILGDISFSVPSQAFQDRLSVSLTTAVADAEIRYTTNGALPRADSPLYTATPIAVSETTQLRAQAFVGEQAVGAPSTALYIARDFEATSNLPIVLIDGYAAGLPESREVFSDMAFLVFEPEAGEASLSNLPTLATRAGYHLRGQSSATFEKAPYRVELWDNASEDADLPLLGMPPEADWALVGPFVDRSLVRHAFAYTLGAAMGMAVPRFAFAEVYLNADNATVHREHYQGVYMVVETIKNQKNRLDLRQLREDDTDPDDVTGGYIFKFDWMASEAPTLDCSGSEPLGGGGFGFGFGGANSGGTCWTDLEVVDPTPLNSVQRQYLTDYVQSFHDSLHNNPLSQFAPQINVPSFVDQFIINELTRDIDSYTRSAFFYKDKDGPLSAGPLWDYNLTLGVGFGGHREVQGWQWEERQVASDWFRILGANRDFLDLVSARWQVLRGSLLSNEQLLARIDSLAEPLTEAAERDFQRWPVQQVSGSIFELPTSETWAGQLNSMQQWLLQRVAWLDTQL